MTTTRTVAQKCRRAAMVADIMHKRCATDAAFVRLVKTLKAKARTPNAKLAVKIYVMHEIKCHARMLERKLASDTDCACFACLSYVATTKCKCGKHLVCKGCEEYCD